MANTRAHLSLALTLLVLSPCCLAQTWGIQGQIPGLQAGQRMTPRRLHRGQQIKNECEIDRLSANEPNIRQESEAGVTEIWEPNDQQFRCAGVTVVRHVVEPKGLVLPAYANAPHITYIIQGNAILGVNIPGCPETYESGSRSSSPEQLRGSESESRGDQHQKIRRIRQGDVIAMPAGVSKWLYNDGEDRLTCISLYDTNNFQNQLDENLREFFLAGNPQAFGQEQGRHQTRRHSRGRGIRGGEGLGNNILSGFDKQLLAEAFEVDPETINRIQGQDDNRGSIIRVEGDLEFLTPEDDEGERETTWEPRHEYERHGRRGGRGCGRGGRWNEANGLEENFCTLRLRENLDTPRKADVFNSQGGRLTSLNSHKLPILNYLQLSAERVKLYQNAIMAPHWTINAHKICYFTRGQGRVQVVNHRGELVLDDMVQEGQLLVIPQNFAVVQRAGREGLEWVAFLTNDEAMISPLAGRISAIRGMPEEVVMNSYGVSREEAKRLKYSRQELTVFSPSFQSQRRGEEYAIV